MPDPRAFPTSILVEEAQILFGVSSQTAGAALFGHAQGMTVTEAAELISAYTNEHIAPTGIEIALRAGPFTVGDGVSSSFTIPHFLGNSAPVVTVYDNSQSPAAVIGVEIQEGSDDNHTVISANAWEETPPALNSIEVTVVG